MDTIEKIQRIEQDFTEGNEPFDDVEFPEERLIREIKVIVGDSNEPVSLSMEDRLRLISMFATFDYNRDANQLVDNLLVLQRQEPKFFDAWNVNTEGELEEIFKEIGFRYPSRDAHAWAENCRILRNKYHGGWHELLLDTGLDAERLVERLNSDDFLCVKGVKIAPMYCRIINDEVAELDKLWELDIPVDTHIRRLSQELFEMPEADDDEIRETWYFYGVQNDIDRHTVDGGLWHIGNKWDDWGEEYWGSL
jgi:hypothetical protein